MTDYGVDHPAIHKRPGTIVHQYDAARRAQCRKPSPN
jgi:hypothetical protein